MDRQTYKQIRTDRFEQTDLDRHIRTDIFGQTDLDTDLGRQIWTEELGERD
jgi:hypothetical protein